MKLKLSQNCYYLNMFNNYLNMQCCSNELALVTMTLFFIRGNVRKIDSMLKLSFPTPSVEDSGNYRCTALFSNTLTLEAEVRVDFYGKYSDLWWYIQYSRIPFVILRIFLKYLFNSWLTLVYNLPTLQQTVVKGKNLVTAMNKFHWRKMFLMTNPSR